MQINTYKSLCPFHFFFSTIHHDMFSRKCQEFYWACEKGNLELVQSMMEEYLKSQTEYLDEPFYPNAMPNKENMTPFHVACHNGHAHVVKYLMNIDAIFKHGRDWEYDTPLISACKNGHVGVVSLLLSLEGLIPNLRNLTGWTALHYASGEGFSEIVSILLSDPRVNPNIWAWTHLKTPLDVALNEKKNNVIELLVACERVDVNRESSIYYTPFIKAIDTCNERAVEILMSRKETDIFTPNSMGKTPLMVACNRGLLNTVKRLILNGSQDLDKSGMNGNTPIALAIERSRRDIVKLIFAVFPGEINLNVNPVGDIRCTLREVIQQMNISDQYSQEHNEYIDVLKRYAHSPGKTKLELMRDPIVDDVFFAFSVRLFALASMVSTGELKITTDEKCDKEKVRFFNVTKGLPVEIKMLASSRAYRYKKTIFPSKDVVEAIRYLLRYFPERGAK